MPWPGSERWKAKELLGLRSVLQAHFGAVIVVQRCSGDLALNVHYHSLISDGVFVEERGGGPASFHELPAPTDDDVADIASEARLRRRGGRETPSRVRVWRSRTVRFVRWARVPHGGAVVRDPPGCLQPVPERREPDIQVGQTPGDPDANLISIVRDLVPDAFPGLWK
jgi:hypothetical protein